MSLFNNKYIQFNLYRDADLEAFYDIDSKYRRSIIFAHMMIHFLPVLIVVLFFREYWGEAYMLEVWSISLLCYAAIIVETTAYMYPKSRKHYKRLFPWLLIPFAIICGYGGYVIGAEVFKPESGLRQLSTLYTSIGVGCGVFLWTYLGMSLILKASRAIYTKKAAIEADVRFATEVQKRILEDVAIEKDSTSAYAMSVPANELGGDFFELSQQDDTILACVGDVSGHSFGAGLLMTMTKSALQTHLEYNSDPSEITKALNGMFLKQSDRAMYATMAMLKLNISSQKAEVCNAGHLPVLHYVAATEELVTRRNKGLGLGMVSKAEYTNLEFSVDKEDVLFLYSDGLIETRDENLEVRDFGFFEHIIKRRVAENHTDPKKLTSAILKDTEESDYSDRFEDDATLVAIKV
ncbi:PP2C family protein-serine/threonine phosphatase [Rhodohalobacter sp.]|uniref:PP2C family protein-serine/threonine phosphatase n=1 Tax=Rhodohalobacter sp. TaxID=1974210 RepID=UPI002ACD2B80|nr:PP2C family protein-serine/threonine phosphatase [Rhodohalobacter sp.]MDZ7756452.1 PP2C family protein-serine/threonine phosphatase [Rhodohalobacter sp.]